MSSKRRAIRRIKAAVRKSERATMRRIALTSRAEAAKDAEKKAKHALDDAMLAATTAGIKQIELAHLVGVATSTVCHRIRGAKTRRSREELKVNDKA